MFIHTATSIKMIYSKWLAWTLRHLLPWLHTNSAFWHFPVENMCSMSHQSLQIPLVFNNAIKPFSMITATVVARYSSCGSCVLGEV